MRLLITGASGLIGSALARDLSRDHEVLRLVRGAPRQNEARWDPAAGTIDAERLRGVDAAIHLAGESVAERWTAAKKERILRSRVDGTRLLVRTLAALEPRPKALL